MKRKVIWVVVSCLVVLSLVLAACAKPVAAPPKEEVAPPKKEEVAPPKKEEVAPPKVAEKVAPPKAELVKVTLTKFDGSKVVVEKEKPKYGGVLRLVHGVTLVSAPDRFDQATGHLLTAPAVITNETLILADWAKGPSGTAEISHRIFQYPHPTQWTGGLAESVEFPDPNTMVFHIRKGVRFQDKPPTNGREMTADDVLFSLKRLWDTPTAYEYNYMPKATFIESLTAPDKWTVVLKAKPGKLGGLTDFFPNRALVVPRDAVEAVEKAGGSYNDWKLSLGTGPFRLTDYVFGSGFTMERHPNYWQKDPFFPENTLPYVDAVRYVIVPDTSTLLAALRTAKFDVVNGVLWGDADSVRKTTPELKYSESVGTSTWTLAWRNDRKPFDDIRVRKALMMAVDKQKMIDTYYGGHADMLGWPVFNLPEFSDVYWPVEKLPESARELWEYHPDKAKQLLAEAGYPNGFKTQIVIQPAHADEVSIIKDYWAKIGVDLELVVKEPAAHIGILMGKTYDQIITSPVSGAVFYNFVYERKGNPYNGAMINDPRVEETFVANSEAYFDPVKRAKQMRDILPYMLGQAWLLPLPQTYVTSFWWPWVKGYSGETSLGTRGGHFVLYAWVDQELKKNMGK